MQAGFNRCAHACLAMVASHCGVDIGPDHWLRQGGPLSTMPSAWDLMSWARGLGLVAEAVAFEFEEIGQLRVPAILHCGNRHFVVLEGVDESQVAIVDPRRGRLRTSMALARDLFSGIAIEIAPR